MSEIETTLTKAATLIKTISGLSKPASTRVWVHPTELSSITLETLPAVIVSKANTSIGSWKSSSYGVGMHQWDMLIAVYLEAGPVVVTSNDDLTYSATIVASEWYKALADLLFQNMTLDGSVMMIGDGEGTLFEYVTDNIIWDGKHYWGHFFIVPILQEITQAVSS